MAKKFDMAKKAKEQPVPDSEDFAVTEALLNELVPAEYKAAFKKAKTQGARADLYYEMNNKRLELNRQAKTIEDFTAKLGKWFIQELPDKDSTGVAGKVARIQVKDDTVPRVMDWSKFYAHIKKNNAFELLNRAVNAKSVKERWDNKKQVPGVDKFSIKKISITKVK